MRVKASKCCARCGKTFDRHPKYSDKQWQKRNYCSRRCAAIQRNPADDGNIISMYEGGMSSMQVARVVGMSDTHIRRILVEHGKPINDPRHYTWKGGIRIDEFGYLRFNGTPANGVNAGRKLHVVLAEAMIGRRLNADEVVHHIDGDKLNNHPNNLEVMTRSQHTKLHWEQKSNG